VGDNAEIADVLRHGFYAPHPGERFSSRYWIEFSGESPKKLDRISSLKETPRWVLNIFYHRQVHISSLFPPVGDTDGNIFFDRGYEK
jgi:hypothetical protein